MNYVYFKYISKNALKNTCNFKFISVEIISNADELYSYIYSRCFINIALRGNIYKRPYNKRYNYYIIGNCSSYNIICFSNSLRV